MGEDKNVFLTIMRNEEENADDELKIDLGLIAKRAKRLLALWLCLSVGLGCLSGATGLVLQKVFSEEASKALISFPNTDYDITKIKSPAVVGDTLQEMGLDILDMEKFREAVEISGLIPNSDYEQLSMYYDLFHKSDSNETLTVINSLLDSGYHISRYVISFHYPDVQLSRKDGIAFLNSLLRAYRDYCIRVYKHDAAMGNPLSVIDYREYDYAEAANIFANSLSSAASYLSSLESAAGSFRSTETGLTFADLHRTVNLLREIDLNRVSSYIVIHSVSDNDADTEISYYRWRIEMLEQQRNIQRTRYYSLQESIDNYRKDDILIINGINGNSVVSSPADVNANYDAMIQEKLDAQSSIASCTRSISYYESVILGFQNAESGVSRPEDIEFVRGHLETLNEKTNELIRDITRTADEYYQTVAFSNEVRILIPSSAEKTPLVTETTLKIVAVTEALLFVWYLCVASVKGIQEANPPKEKPLDEPKPEPEPEPEPVASV